MVNNKELQDNISKGMLDKNIYIKTLFSKYSFWKILKVTVVFIILIGLLDIKNIPTKFLSNGIAYIIGFLLGAIFLLALLMEKHIFEIGKIIVINDYDFFLCIVNVFAVLYLLSAWIVQVVSLYKVIVLMCIFVLTIYMICHRKYKYEEMVKNANDYCSNTIDLKDLYEGSISNAGEMVFLDEHEVDYDLLNRRPVIDFLYNTLCQCKPEGRFVISLEGKWGVGKTTILKNVKKRIQQEQKDIVIIDDFDPWMYGTEEALIENFFNILLKNNSFRINTPEIRKSILTLTEAIISSNTSLKGKTALLEEVFRKDNLVYESKKLIEEYLRLYGKKIIIFIDNLDRIEDEKIIFLFKLIANVLNFDRIIFVISFDPEKVKAIFDKQLNIDYSYLEKIIQMQIKVPKADGNIFSGIIQTCTENIIKNYSGEIEKLNEYSEFIQNITESIADIRSYKRIVNSVIIKALYNNSNLSKRDLLVIEYIRMQNPELYKIIYDNRKFFISDGTMYDLDLYVNSFHKDEFEKEAKEFFKKLFEDKEYEKYYKVLVRIFPNIDKYSKKINYHKNRTVNANQIEKTRGIANAKYFSLYFSETENEFSMLGGEIETFIKDLNEGKNNIEEKFSSLLKLYNASLNREMLEAMELYIPEIEDDACYQFSRLLVKKYWDIENRLELFLINARRRCCVIIWELLQRIDNEQYTGLVTSLSEAYDKIEMIESVSSEYESNKDRGVGEPERYEIWKNLEDNLLTNILENNIDLYDDIYYHPHNIWVLYRKSKENTAIFRTYIRNVCSEKNIFRILYDIMRHSVGSGHTYYFSKEYIECFFEAEELKKYLQDIKANTEDECFLLELYSKYLENPNDKDGMKTGITFPEERKMNF